MNEILKKICLVVVFIGVTIPMLAFDIEVEGIYFNVNVGDSPTCEVTNGDNLYEGIITIPSEITYKDRTLPVVGIGSMAFNDCVELTNVIIPETVKSIGWRAFDGCSNLTDIKLPSGIELIDGLAFEGCASLSSFLIPESITKIEISTFSGCSSLTSVNIPDNIREIASGAFENCSSLTELRIPNSVTSIGHDAFAGCYNIGKLEIDNDSEPLLLHLEPYNQKTPFGECHIAEIYIGRNISYKQDQFGGAQPIDVKGDYTLLLGEFKKMLINLAVGGSIKTVNIQNGYLNDKFDKLEIIRVEESASTIDWHCFAECKSLQCVFLASSVNKINGYAFSECPELLTIISHNPIPPTLDKNVFDSNTYVNGLLYVPSQSIDSYKETEGWKNFWSIKSLDDYSGITNVEDKDNSTTLVLESSSIHILNKDERSFVRVYSIHGSMITETSEDVVYNLPNGVYIVTVGDKSFKVFMQ